MKRMKMPTLVGTMLASMVAFTAIPVSGANAAGARPMPCAAHGDMVSFLEKRYKESPRALGLVSVTGLMEIYVSKKGSWSILMTTTKGKSCIIAAGNNWVDAVVKVAGDPA
ncbi:MAG: hypothetical protein JKY10_01195 [Cohaesibacteraceae bacterium]|nr:hypothetical protein [Cohaesibacteraceae bacterium]